MEIQPNNNNNNNHTTTTMMKKINSSSSKNRSMSDADSQTSQAESFHSPLHSPFGSDSPLDKPDNSKAIVAAGDKYYSPHRSPPRLNRPKQPENLNFPPPPTTPPAFFPPAAKVRVDKSVRDDVASGVTKVGPAGLAEGLDEEEGGGVGGERRSRSAVANILRRTRRDVTVEKAALGFRVCEVILCLISFSVMAADKTQGWSGDSFDRYKEYRYCLAVAVISFVYSGFQAYDLAYHLVTEKHVISHHLRYHIDFLMDQILTYLLLSASSSAATRVDDWVSNWGKDQFTEMATASIGMSFLAFVAFALSSLVSGFNLCNRISNGL